MYFQTGDLADDAANFLYNEGADTDAETVLRMKEALEKIAAFEDESANKVLRDTGSYSAFDSPGDVKIARECLQSLKYEKS